MGTLGEPDEGGAWAMRSKLVGLQTKNEIKQNWDSWGSEEFEKLTVSIH